MAMINSVDRIPDADDVVESVERSDKLGVVTINFKSGKSLIAHIDTWRAECKNVGEDASPDHVIGGSMGGSIDSGCAGGGCPPCGEGID